jgi:exosortase
MGETQRVAALILAIIALLALLYAPVFVIFGTAWATYSEYNYAFLIPAVSAFLVWRRWPVLRRQPVQPDRRGGVVLGAGLALLLLGIATDVHVAEGLSFIPVVLGLVWFLWGDGAARVVLFPAAYLVCALGLFRGLASSVGFAMQGLTARYAHVLVNLTGVHAQRDGLMLSVGHYHYIVAESCSGLGSLLSLLALGWLIVSQGSGSLRSKIILFLSITPLVLAANIIRVALVLVIAEDVSRAIAEGFVHSLFSVAIFVISLLLLLIVREVLMWLDRSGMASLPQAS